MPRIRSPVCADGLSYTNFTLGCTAVRMADEYRTAAQSSLTLPINVTCVVANTGGRRGDEVVMVYHTVSEDVRAAAKHPVPIKALVNFGRVSVAAGTDESLHFVLTEEDVLLVDETGEDRLYRGNHTLLFSRGHGLEVSFEVSV